MRALCGRLAAIVALIACASCSTQAGQASGTLQLLAPALYGPRGVDAGGSGAFLAPRGDHRHRGYDILVRAGDPVRAPISGRVLEDGRCYADDGFYRYVAILGDDGALVKIFYVERAASVPPGRRVRAGDTIGWAQAISTRYGGRLPDHLHVEVWVQGVPVDPEPLLEWRA